MKKSLGKFSENVRKNPEMSGNCWAMFRELSRKFPEMSLKCPANDPGHHFLVGEGAIINGAYKKILYRMAQKDKRKLGS